MSEEKELHTELPEQDEVTEIIPGYSNIEQFTKEGFKTLIGAIKNSNALPNDRDFNFYSAHESFNKILNNEGNHILTLINKILHSNSIKGNVKGSIIEEKTELLIEANDVILEKAANNIDEMNGVRKSTIEPVLIQTVSAQLPINGSWNRLSSATFSVSSSASPKEKLSSSNAIRLLTAKNIVRPQKFFKDKIENSNLYPWQPRITDKPNSLKPLAIFLEKNEFGEGEAFCHPYEVELDHFTPTTEQLRLEEPIQPKPVLKTPLVQVNTPEQIDDLVEKLRKCESFAVDLEHHSYRSFMGITCLMQISTTEEDYIIDTLALRDKLYKLNEVFTKPSIVKIFHGADMDILWLQRDLSLYVVNMFDTYQAAKQLEYSGLSLAYLMNRFCNLLPNKQFQLADWRIRPLPQVLIDYAREDTHYLIYIYQMLKKELLEKGNRSDNHLKSVINKSIAVCKKVYIKNIWREDSHLDFYQKCKRLFDNRQMYALKELYKWRDHIAREEDESTGYVLPNHMLLQISESLPRELQGILACCNPIPPLVRANALELHQIILRARDQSMEKPILGEETRARGSTKKFSKINVDSPLHCPHDLTKSNEFRDDLPTLLGDSQNTQMNVLDCKVDLEIESTEVSCFIFSSQEDSIQKIEAEKNKCNFTFLAPYERYKLVKPFIQAEEERAAAERERAKSEKQDEIKSNETNINPRTIIGDNRSDEERIASIRDHFMMLSKKTEEEELRNQNEEPASLLQMGGSKKRKRDPSPDRSNINDGDQYNTISGAHFQTPKPILPNFRFNKDNRKRKFSPGGNNYNEPLNENKQGKKNNKNKKRKLQQNKQKNKSFNNKKDFQSNVVAENDFPQVDYGNQDVSNQGPSNRHNVLPKRFPKNNPREKFNKKSNKNNRRFQNNQEEAKNFAPFDYSSVDFRQFQGGAGAVQGSKNIKSNFKAKGKKRNGNKSFNKSTIFENKTGRR